MLALTLGYAFLVYPRFLKTKAAPTPFSWTQDNWSGGASVDHSNINSGWSKYDSKNNITVNGSNQLELTTITDTNTSLLLHGDGVNGSTLFTDSSLFNHILTAHGSTTITTADSVIGGSAISIPGSSSYLSLPFSSDFALGSGDFTIDFWAKFNDLAQIADFFLIKDSSGAYYFDAYYFGGTLAMWNPASGRVYQAVVSGASPMQLTAGEWHHIAYQRKYINTISGTGPEWEIYLDGVSNGGLAVINDDPINTAGADIITIGSLPALGRSFNGVIDEFRITKGVARYLAFYESTGLPVVNGGYQSFTPTHSPYYVTSFTPSGDLISSVIDAGSTIEWSSADITSTIDTGTAAYVQIRTSTDGSSWSCNWTGESACTQNSLSDGAGSVSISSLPNGRYIQYRTLLSTTNVLKTPKLQNISFSGIVHLATPALSFSDNVNVGPVASDSIVPSWDNAVVKKWKYNSNTSCSSNPADYTDGATIPTQVDETNNGKYICLYGENDNGNVATLASSNSINIDATGPTLSFTNNVEAGPVKTSDSIAADWGDATVKRWKYNSTSSCPTDSSLYTDSTTIPDQIDGKNNGQYICLYGEDSLGNKSTLASTNAINMETAPPSAGSGVPRQQNVLDQTSQPQTPTTSVTPTNTLAEVQASPIPPFDLAWGLPDRINWALNQREAIYNLYVTLLLRNPSPEEVNWWLAQDNDIYSIRYNILTSEEYLSKH